MTDQWPRYEVFKQDRPDGPFRNVGSVHAPDAELALMNARDVFARRPACVALWVVPAAALLARTAEEMMAEQGRTDAADNVVAVRGEMVQDVQYAVFSKRSNRQAMTYVEHVGEIDAPTPEAALRRAVVSLGEPPAQVWWACPAADITRSAAEDIPGFAAATSKLLRLPNQYHTVFTMRQLRRGEEGDE